MRSIIYSLMILGSVLIFSCNEKEADERIYNTCLVTKLYLPATDTGQSSSKYYWDANDRPTRWDMGGPGDLLFTYPPGQVKMSATNEDSHVTYFLSADSTTYFSTWYLQGNRMDSTLYYYNSDKQLVKMVRYTAAFGKDSVGLTWTNGNITRIVIYGHNGINPKAEMEYTDIPQKSWLYQHVQPFIGTTLYLPWLGKPNVNLTKVVRSEFNGMPDPETMSYTMNASGYIKNMTMTFMNQSNEYVYEYNCR